MTEPLAYKHVEYGDFLVMPAILMCTIWWPTFDDTDSPLFLLSTQFLYTESIVKGIVCHICM
jgi:hypothetical protein